LTKHHGVKRAAELPDGSREGKGRVQLPSIGSQGGKSRR